jgi:hypothetical protein
MRLYNSERELFKKVFEPLKMLGVQSQFSWGVLGLKQETLKQMEFNLNNPNSVHYLGQDEGERLTQLLDFKTDDINRERFEKITADKNNYFSYIYASIFIKQIQQQWNDAGFPISDRPEILATLYNIGFQNSNPKAEPESGGAEIEVAGQKYSFGRLAYEFYYSNEFSEELPI